jgi:hypothetical protein
MRLSSFCACVLGSFALLAAAADRSPAVRAEFRKLHPCPATGKQTGACPGWQIDHREALVCGGRDELANLQWLPVAEHREKTRAEVKLCRTNKHTKGKSLRPER